MSDNKCEHCSFEVNALKELMITKFESLKEIVDRIDERIQTQNGRVGSLERYRSYLIGGLSILSLIIGYLFYEK